MPAHFGELLASSCSAPDFIILRAVLKCASIYSTCLVSRILWMCTGTHIKLMDRSVTEQLLTSEIAMTSKTFFDGHYGCNVDTLTTVVVGVMFVRKISIRNCPMSALGAYYLPPKTNSIETHECEVLEHLKQSILASLYIPKDIIHVYMI